MLGFDFLGSTSALEIFTAHEFQGRRLSRDGGHPRRDALDGPPDSHPRLPYTQRHQPILRGPRQVLGEEQRGPEAELEKASHRVECLIRSDDSFYCAESTFS